MLLHVMNVVFGQRWGLHLLEMKLMCGRGLVIADKLAGKLSICEIHVLLAVILLSTVVPPHSIVVFD